MIKITDLEHQNNVCMGLVEYLKKRKKQDLVIIGIPDQIEKNVPAVDLWFKDPEGHEYVLEHTLIESYPEQLRDKKAFEEVFLPLEEELKERLPGPAHYLLEVAADELDNDEKTATARGRLKDWIESRARELQRRAENKGGTESAGEEGSIREGVPGVSPEMVLYRKEIGSGSASLTIKRLLPDNLEEKRKQRMEKALVDKCPKLKEARGNDRTSILLLEMLEDRISNHRDAAAMLTELLPLRNDNPDQIYLIETKATPWRVYLLKDGESIFPEVEDPGPHQL